MAPQTMHFQNSVLSSKAVSKKNRSPRNEVVDHWTNTISTRSTTKIQLLKNRRKMLNSRAPTTRQLSKLKNCKKMNVVKMIVKCYFLARPSKVLSVAWVAPTYSKPKSVLPAKIMMLMTTTFQRVMP